MKNTVTINAYFDDIEFEIKRELRKAKEKSGFVSPGLAFVLIKNFFWKIDEGVEVHILCNGDSINFKNLDKIVHERLLSSILLVRNPIPCALIHHKFCIIDDSTIITGSFNWSNTAYYHYENVTVIKMTTKQ